MNYSRLFLYIFIVGAFFVTTITHVENRKSGSFAEKEGQVASAKSYGVHPDKFFDEKNFYEGIKNEKDDSANYRHRIKGGIIPHHLLPGFILSDFYSKLAYQKPKTIILVGPNHYELGSNNMLVTRFSWSTKFGQVQPNLELIGKLTQGNLVKIEDEVFSNEHSMSGMMPYVKYYLPEAKVVPIILSGHTTRKETIELANRLMPMMNDETVIIAPVDFSHYLNNKEAKEKNKLTLRVLSDYDYQRLFTLNNDYTDSPPALATLLQVMELNEYKKMDVLFDTNSGEILSDDFVETTSYFSIVYY